MVINFSSLTLVLQSYNLVVVQADIVETKAPLILKNQHSGVFVLLNITKYRSIPLPAPY